MGRTLSVWSCAATSVALIALGSFALAGPAQAAAQTRYVATTGSDTDNDCTDSQHPCATVQHAVGQANAGDTVQIAAGTYDESVTVTTSLTIEGAGTSGSHDTRIDGNDGGDSIDITGVDSESTPHVTIRDLDVSHNPDGSGIGVQEADVTVVDSVASDNSQDGIDIAENPITNLNRGARAAADATPSVTVTDTTTSGNADIGVYVETGTATVQGATVDGNADGGVVVEQGTVHVAQSTLARNVGAGLVLDGNDSTGTLLDSTVADTASFDEVDRPAFGGGVLVFPSSSVTVDTSTIDGNQGEGVLAFAGTATISNSTISGTRASSGTGPEEPAGGIAVTAEVPEVARAAQREFGSHHTVNSAVRPRASTDLVTVTGTIDADNEVPACGGDTQAIADDGYNLAGDTSCPFTATGSKQKAKAKLGALADNGGPTETRLPAKGSAAIDAIPTGKANCSDSATDQRGVSRPQGHRCDIGAVEAAQPPIVVKPSTLPHGTVGKKYSVQLTATGGLGAPYEFSLASGSGPLPAGLTLTSHGLISGTPKAAGSYPITVSIDDPTLRHYVIVIAAGASSSSSAPSSSAPSSSAAPTSAASSSTAPLAATGTSVVQMSAVGIAAIAVGVVMMVLAGWTHSRRRHRPRHTA